MPQRGTAMSRSSASTARRAAVTSRSSWGCVRATRSPISDTFARYQNAENRHRESMIKNNKTFFVPWETIHESNPQEILEREEKVTLVPFLIMQGALDDNVLPAAQENFVKIYKAAGGNVE